MAFRAYVSVMLLLLLLLLGLREDIMTSTGYSQKTFDDPVRSTFDEFGHGLEKT